MALLGRRPSAELLFHSDRGSQYTSDAYRAVLAEAGITVSISRTGNSYDIAVTESFFGTHERANVWNALASRHEDRPGKPFSSMSNASTIEFGDTLHSAMSVRLRMNNRCVNPNVSGFHKNGSTSHWDNGHSRKFLV